MVAEFLKKRLRVTHMTGADEAQYKTNTYGQASWPPLELGLMKNHIFINRHEPYSRTYVRNWKAIEKYYARAGPTDHYAKKRFQVTRVKTSDGETIPVLDVKHTRVAGLKTAALLRLMFKEWLIIYDERVKPLRVKQQALLTSLTVPTEQVPADQCVQKKKKSEDKEEEKVEKGWVNYCCDFEAFTDGAHVPCLAACLKMPSVPVSDGDILELLDQVQVFEGTRCVEEMFDYIKNDVRQEKALQNKEVEESCYWHNLKYVEVRFTWRHWSLGMWYSKWWTLIRLFQLQCRSSRKPSVAARD